jgi:hypothetical protein
MSRARNTTTAPTGSIAPLGLRLLPELRNQIEDAARTNGRSLNAEVTARLQSSFKPVIADLPFAVAQAVESLVEDEGFTPEEALSRLVLAGQSQGGTVLHIRLAPGTTAREMHDLLKIALKAVPNPNLVVENEKGQ